jgi:hypothetical protein
MTRAHILERTRVNRSNRSRRYALKSILHGSAAIVALSAILITSGCVGTTSGAETGSTTASLGLSPSTVSFGNVTVGHSGTKTVTLTSAGNGILTISGISVAGNGFTASGPHLPISLSAGQSTTISVLFKPTASAADTGTVTIRSNSVEPSMSVALSGTGTTASTSVLSVSPASVAFGTVAVGSEVTKTVQLASTGTASVTISGMTFSGSGVSVSGLAVPMTLAAGKDVNLTITYKPSSAGTLAGSVSIRSNASDPSEVVSLSGTATTAPTSTLTATPSSIAFGNVSVGSEVTKTVQLASTGNRSVTISGMTFSGPGVSVSGLAVPRTLAPGQDANFTVTYKPSSAGTLRGSVAIASNASDSSDVVGLTGTATTAPTSALTATPSSITFGNVVVGTESTQTIRLANSGTTNVTVSGLAPSVAAVSVSGLSVPLTLAPGKSANFTAAFKPTAASSVSGKITVTSNASDSSMPIVLTGTGESAVRQLTVSPTSVSFGNAAVGSSNSKQVTVKNTGNINANISSVAVTGTGFSLSGSSTSVALNPGQSETYTVNFAPKSAGSDTGMLSIASNAPSSPVKVGVSGTAVTSSTSHSVALSWDRSSSTVVGYFVYRSSKPSGPYARVNSSADASTSYSDSTVAGGQVYYYVVTAVDSSNIESAHSNQVSVTVPTN